MDKSLLRELSDKIQQMSDDRDWDKLHSPKNISTNIGVEAAELAEIFVWKTDEESYKIEGETLKHTEQEIADVFINLIIISDKLGIDLFKATDEKIDQICSRYPPTAAVHDTTATATTTKS